MAERRVDVAPLGRVQGHHPVSTGGCRISRQDILPESLRIVEHPVSLPRAGRENGNGGRDETKRPHQQPRTPSCRDTLPGSDHDQTDGRDNQRHQAKQRQVHPVFERRIRHGHDARRGGEQEEACRQRERPGRPSQNPDGGHAERREDSRQFPCHLERCGYQWPVVIETETCRPEREAEIVRQHLGLRQRVPQRRVDGLAEFRVFILFARQHECHHAPCGGHHQQEGQRRAAMALMATRFIDPPISRHDQR